VLILMVLVLAMEQVMANRFYRSPGDQKEPRMTAK